MKVGIVAPPFIPVPPRKYGGTELFIAQLTSMLMRMGHDVIVYANGESTVSAEVRWIFPTTEWPVDPASAVVKNLTHVAWAVRDAAAACDIVHLNDALGVFFSEFIGPPVVHTLHHPHEPQLSDIYQRYPEVHYVTISRFQQQQEHMARLRTIHHGIPLDKYEFRDRKQPYLCFLGRIAPVKGPHLAIDVAKRTGLPLRMAGEIQPMFRGYWETAVRPQVDGRHIEYVGEADHDLKCELLSNAMALLFPIQWDEPFGLVMIEAMACGTPVLALSGGSVEEVVKPGVSGWICRDVDEMAARALALAIPAATCRQFVSERFSAESMAANYAALYHDALDGAPSAEGDESSTLPMSRS
jgi:glycosyltransferase involved in cell wall biosynthesis